MIEERVRGEEEEKEKEVSGLDKARLSQLPRSGYHIAISTNLSSRHHALPVVPNVLRVA
jgi:hypothetical protein